MRGFQPQKFADGGLVQGLKRAFGMDEERNARVAAYRAQAAQEAAQKQQAAPAPAPAPAVSDYMGMGAMARREKAAGLKDGGTVKPRGFKAGGLIRGPGTGTSDSIETAKRPGTFIMPADSTQAIGPEALEELGEVGDSAMEEQGESVPVRLSNGEFELPPEQVQALGASVLTVMRDATHKPVRGFAPQAQPEEPRQFFVNGGEVKRMAAGFMPGTRSVFNESGKAIGDLVGQGRYGAAAGETARAALAYGPAVVDDVVGGAWRAAVPAVADAGKQFLGIGDSAPAPSAPAPGTTPKPASPPMPSASPAQVQPATAATAPVGEPTAKPAAQPLSTGPITAQNNAAAEALSAPRAVGFAPGGASTAPTAQVTAPVVRNSTNDWAARNAIRSAQVSASSITNDPSRIGARAAALSPDNLAFQAALKNDQALQLAQPGMDLAAMRENSALQREGMQQSGADQRSARGFQIDNRRAAVEEKRASTEAEARGFDIRQGYRQEKLSERYDAAKTPEEKAAIAQQIRDLSGKQTESPWKLQVTPTTKNADGSTTEGSVMRYNTQTGAVERVDAGQVGAQQPLDKNQQAIAVRDNPNLSREQKVAALRKFGYQG
ncbi:hypothetical protein IB236_13180 [Acidovorax sp. ACV02]|uniref:hypothetical protein n=1 Tax=Acidovorax sp. ACV02 TaxID=2769310 RepID=UPI00177AE175|nr:hypothetical protein [Acidovorax sp. ACV02]MBD9406295.1 hypothetical protein [Acidovorax sp. ACV02]